MFIAAKESSKYIRKVQQLYPRQQNPSISNQQYSPGQASLVATILIPDMFLAVNWVRGALKSGREAESIGREALSRGRSM
jgi:hypothetical protein